MQWLTELKRRIPVTDDDRAQATIDDAIALVAMHTGWTVEAADKWPRMGKLIVLSTARRVYQNPQGLEYETVGSYSARRSDTTSSGQLELTKSELQQLRKLTGRSGLGSIKVARG